MSEQRHLTVTLSDGTVVAVSATKIGGGRRGSGFIRVPWSLRDEFAADPRALGEWVIAEIEAARARRMRRRAYLPDKVWQQILDRFGHRCAYCGAVGVPLEREHVIPWSKGGATDEENIVPACAPCNREKGTRVWEPR